jgi:lysophospholipase L1-like esterase
MSKTALLLTAAALAVPQIAVADPAKLAGIGDSISQGFAANNFPGDHADMAFGQGTDREVNSLYLRYKARFPAFAKEFVSVSGAEMVGGSNNAAAQAGRICRQTTKPDRVVIELGGNDVCNRGKGSASDAASNLYSVTTYRNALKAALDTLGGCLPAGSQVLVMSMPRVDFLHEAGNAKNAFACNAVWGLAGICSIVTSEGNATRRRQIGARIDQYNDGLRVEVQAAQSRYGSKVKFLTDWQGPLSSNPKSSVGAYQFGKDDIDSFDCFHPYRTTGHKRLACAAWEASEYGVLSNIRTTCLQ